MSKSGKIVFGLATLLPVFFVFMMILSFAWMAVSLSAMQNTHQPEFPPQFFLIFVFELLMLLSAGALMVFYFIDLYQTDRIEGNTKVLWSVLFFTLHIFSMAAYWYLYIWSEPKQAAENPTQPDDPSQPEA
jgi:hypothetical protein